MISRRYLVPLAIVLGIALLPTLRHGYFGYVAAAPKVSDALLPTSVAGMPGVSRPRASAWTSAYGADSVAERTYPLTGRGEVSLFVARGFDMKKLYHHPELGVLRGRSLRPSRSAVLPGSGQPVHVLENVSEGGESAVYALVYEGRWIENPYLLQLSSSVTALWSGRRPLTLVFAYGTVLEQGQPSAKVADLLVDAVRRLDAAPATAAD